MKPFLKCTRSDNLPHKYLWTSYYTGMFFKHFIPDSWHFKHLRCLCNFHFSALFGAKRFPVYWLRSELGCVMACQVDEQYHIGGSCSCWLNIGSKKERGRRRWALSKSGDLAPVSGGRCCVVAPAATSRKDICSTAPPGSHAAAHGGGGHLKPVSVSTCHAERLAKHHAGVHVGRPVYRHVSVSRDRHQFAAMLGEVNTSDVCRECVPNRHHHHHHQKRGFFFFFFFLPVSANTSQ